MLGAILQVIKVGRRLSVAWTVVSAVLVIAQVVHSVVSQEKEAKQLEKPRKRLRRGDPK
jgi:hypothetical protein